MGKKKDKVDSVIVEMDEDVKQELASLVHVYDMLDQLSEEGRRRVLKWIVDYFDIVLDY